MFITLEGLDGVGKTTLAAALATVFTAKGFMVESTREPGGGTIGEAIRDFLKQGLGELHDAELLPLFVGARINHIREIIEPGLHIGAIVLCDRFDVSTELYQVADPVGPDDQFEQIEQNLYASMQQSLLPRFPLLIPDCTILLRRPYADLKQELEGRDSTKEYQVSEKAAKYYETQFCRNTKPHQFVVDVQPQDVFTTARMALQTIQRRAIHLTEKDGNGGNRFLDANREVSPNRLEVLRKIAEDLDFTSFDRDLIREN